MLQAPDAAPVRTPIHQHAQLQDIQRRAGVFGKGDALLRAFARILEREAPRPALVARMLADAFPACCSPTRGKGSWCRIASAYSRALNGFIGVTGAKLPVGVAFRHLLRGRASDAWDINVAVWIAPTWP